MMQVTKVNIAVGAVMSCCQIARQTQIREKKFFNGLFFSMGLILHKTEYYYFAHIFKEQQFFALHVERNAFRTYRHLY